MSGLGNNKLLALCVGLAIGLATAYVNNRYDYGSPMQIDVKADRGMSEKAELVLPDDLWPRQ